MAAMLREYQQGTPIGLAPPIPSIKKTSDMKVISDLFTKIYADRDAHAVQIAALEARIATLEERE